MLPKLYSGDDRFFVIAHRGASAYYPENTMAAFRAAADMKAGMIELDIQLSRDNVPVVFHDAVLDSHTDGTGELSAQTLAELKKLDAGSWMNPAFEGERIPTLEEVLGFATGTIALNIEIKTEAVTDTAENGVEQKCLSLVKEYGMEKHVLFSSFDYRAIRHLKELDPDMPVALLYERKQAGARLPSRLLDDYKADAFNCNYYQLNRKRLADIRTHDIPVFIYTVDNPTRMRKLINKGVTGIFTNKPDVLAGIVESLSD